MRWRASLGVVLLLSGSLSLGAGTQQIAGERLRQAYPGVQLLREGAQLTRVWGDTFGYGLSPEQSAASFVQVHSEVFGVVPEDLIPGNLSNDRLTEPLMFDPQSGRYKFVLVHYTQVKDGVPVFRCNLRLLVGNQAGYPLVWAGSSLRDLGDFSVPADALANINEAAAHAAARAAQPDLLNFGPSSIVIWPGDKQTAPAVAIVFEADNGMQFLPEWGKWLFIADAASGVILLKESRIIYTDVIGSVHGMATTLPKSAECNPEVDMVMPYAKVAIGSTTAYADANGNFTIPNSGSDPVTVTSYMSGTRFNISDQGGTLETLTLSVTPPGPANFMHNQANTSEFIRAEVNGYVQANKVRDWVLTYKPNYPTIATQTNFAVNVNLNSTCNAYYDGSSINFYRAGGGCANTAYSSVIHHEYGHHIVAMGGSGQDAYGEGMGDTVAMLIADDPVLGYGFEGNCSAGIRTGANNYQYPCTGEIHDCGQLLSGCIWSTRNELYATHPSDYLAIISNLTVNSVPMHSGGSITPSIYTDFTTLDGGESGPHHTEIYNGFAAHNMVPGAPPANDACANATVACPGSTYNGSTTAATLDGSASCGSSSTTPDVWFKYKPATSGSAHLELCDSDYDTVLSLHTGCPGTSGNQVGCNDDTGWFGDCGILPTSQSSLTVSVTAGTTYYIRVSGSGGATGAYALNFVSGPACAPADTTPPTPNPMTFATAPAPTGPTAISMTATTATDAGSPPVQYEFEFVSGGPGGAGSGWQASTQYTNSGLAPDTAYTYRVRARDSAAPPNVTGFSGNATATTLANVPAAPTLGNATNSTMDLDVNANGNPSYTVFAVRCTATNPADAVWDGKYVNAAGQPSATEVWRTDAQWGTITIQGLQPSTSYSFAAKARNGNGVETAFGPAATLSTTTAWVKGDMNCDGVVNFADINPFVLALSGQAAYEEQYPTCRWLNADCNDDGTVNFADINPFVALLGS